MDNDNSGKICHLDELSADLKNSFLNPEFSGLNFIVGGRRFAVHKEILASRSSYFKSLLFGGFKEENQREIELKDTNPDVFHFILQYLYTGKLDLSTLELDIILGIMKSSNEWQLSGLMKSVSKYIMGLNINLNNFFTFLNFAVYLDFTELLQKVCCFYDTNTEKILDDPTFNELSFKSVSELLKRNSIHEHEEKVFNAIALWVNGAEVAETKLILNQIKLNLLNPPFLPKIAKESGLFPTPTPTISQQFQQNAGLPANPRSYTASNTTGGKKFLIAKRSGLKTVLNVDNPGEKSIKTPVGILNRKIQTPNLTAGQTSVAGLPGSTQQKCQVLKYLNGKLQIRGLLPGQQAYQTADGKVHVITPKQNVAQK